MSLLTLAGVRLRSRPSTSQRKVLTCVVATCMAILLLLPTVGDARQGDASPPLTGLLTEKDLASAQVQVQLDATIARLAEVGDAAADAPAPLELPLERRRKLLEELLEVVKRREENRNQQQVLPTTRARVAAELEQLKAAEAEIPATVSPAGLKEAEDDLEQKRQSAQQFLEADRARRTRLQSFADWSAKLRERGSKADNVARQLENELGQPEANKELLQLQGENARLDQRVVESTLRAYRAEEEFERDAVGLRELQLETIRAEVARAEAYLSAYQGALARQQARELEAKAAEAKRKERAAARADNDLERFLREWEAKTSNAELRVADLERFKTDLAKDLAAQQKQLDAEKLEQASLEAMLEQLTSGEQSAEVLKSAFARVTQRRQDILRGLRAELRDRLENSRTRRMDVERELFGLRDEWQRQVDLVNLEDPSETARANFVATANTRYESYRQALRDERAALADISSSDNKLRLLLVERRATFDEYESFVLSRVFWVQDAAPLGWDTIERAINESVALDREDSLVNWSKRATLDTAKWVESALGIRSVLFAILLFGVLPLLLAYCRSQLKKAIRAHTQEARELAEKDQEPPVWDRVVVTLWVVLRSTILGAYLLAASWIIGSNSPAIISGIARDLLQHASLFVLLWFLNRAIFRKGSLAVTHYDLPEDTSKVLYGTIRILLLGYFLFLLPWVLLRPAPFQYTAIPRLGFTLFEIAVALGLYRLTRASCPLVRDTIGVGSPQARGWFARNWKLFSGLIALFLMAVLAMDVLGYRFGAARLARSGLSTLAILLVLSSLYRLLMGAIGGMRRRRRRGEETAVRPGEVRGQLERFVTIATVVIGMILVAMVWGINENAYQVLDRYPIHSITNDAGQSEIVSLGDLLAAVMTLVVTIWVLKYLPTLLEVVVFPRIKLDLGLKYAVTAIARYVFFGVGFLVGLSFLHLDMGRLGWLVAALSVGLGFGLQEIVANFVSGIILLLERPIRVGDVVTVGGVTGKITHINIRSTTVRNWDNQEVLVPNRSLITQEVTNWSLTDSLTRLIIPIGVAYGSDVAKVKEVLLAVAKEQPEILTDPAPMVVFTLHADSSLNFEMRVHLPDLSLRVPLQDRLNTLINARLAAAGIEIPFPQRDLHIRSTVENVTGPAEAKLS